MVERVLGWLGHLMGAPEGYALIGLAAALDRSAFVGLVAPGDTLVALGGVFAARGELSLATVMIVGGAGALVGENIAYWLGRLFGRRILDRIPFARRFDRYFERARHYFENRGGAGVIIGRLVSVVGTFLPFTAGMSRMPYPRFVIFDTIGIVVWAVGLSTLGYMLSARLDLVDRILARGGWVIAALLVAYFGGRAIWRRRERIRAWRQTRRDVPTGD